MINAIDGLTLDKINEKKWEELKKKAIKRIQMKRWKIDHQF